MKLCRFNFSKNSLKSFITAVVIVVASVMPNNTAKAQNVPCYPEAKGLYYATPTYNYSPVLYSNMPYDILQAYIIADSILKNEVSLDFLRKMLFKNNVTFDNDTLKYAIKYFYKLSDYNPILFNQYFIAGGKKVSASDFIDGLQEIHPPKNSNKTFYRIINSEYILHIKVNKTEQHYLTDIPKTEIFRDYTVVYCNVIDTLKGQVFPNINTSFIASNNSDSVVTHYGISTANSEITIPTQNTNFIFNYWNAWNKNGTNEITYFTINDKGEKNNPLGLYDSNGASWITPQKEYIVFIALNKICRNNDSVYFALWPLGGSYSYGMYPVENGNVIDEGNVFGWGTSIQITTFKQNLQNIINSIKNYGE